MPALGLLIAAFLLGIAVGAIPWMVLGVWMNDRDWRRRMRIAARYRQ